MSAARTRFIANLDCEEEYARGDAARRRTRGLAAPSPDDPRFGSRPAVRRRIAALGTLCRVFLDDGDRLWTPAPVRPRIVTEVDGIPRPVLEHGPPEDLEPALRTLQWGATTPAARAANARGTAHDLAQRLGVALPGARMLFAADDLRSRLGGDALRIADRGQWVLKAPYSAAGRRRVLGRGREPGEPVLVHAGRLLDLYGRALFEPWVERLVDFGVFVPADGPTTYHRMLTDSAGHFLGIAAPSTDPLATGLAAAEVKELDRAAVAARDELAGLGYRGPFGLDAYRYRTPAGDVRFQPLGELNARYTFGAVAYAAARRLMPGSTEVCTLRLGPAPGPPPSGSCVPLLSTDGAGAVAAWLSIPPGTPVR